ncbi:TIGR04086 family membrane protein [Alkaliphilus sp. B6464]|uniref:TIGR04086 family membrane protein n=1 Tax=Alkaliphilus sp. B6464 TaxID=2731219 RepID=UPI001BA502EA|nr:TIGR04086 family membrane protein [Alkaliphilus sp. B6464]QUH20535.1 TIGR04086 family membrane protein [Alkaliphilus sp. B6464]
MKGGKKTTVKTGPLNIKIYGRGLIRGYIISLLLFLIVAVLITYTSIGENIIPLITSIIMIVGIVFAAIYASVNLRNKGWLHGGIIGLVFILILIGLSKIFIADYSVDRIALYKIGLSMGAGIIGGMLGVNIK